MDASLLPKLSEVFALGVSFGASAAFAATAAAHASDALETLATVRRRRHARCPSLWRLFRESATSMARFRHRSIGRCGDLRAILGIRPGRCRATGAPVARK